MTELWAESIVSAVVKEIHHKWRAGNKRILWNSSSFCHQSCFCFFHLKQHCHRSGPSIYQAVISEACLISCSSSTILLEHSTIKTPVIKILTVNTNPEGWIWGVFYEVEIWSAGIIWYMSPANERRCYNVTSSLTGCAHTQNYCGCAFLHSILCYIISCCNSTCMYHVALKKRQLL